MIRSHIPGAGTHRDQLWSLLTDQVRSARLHDTTLSPRALHARAPGRVIQVANRRLHAIAGAEEITHPVDGILDPADQSLNLVNNPLHSLGHRLERGVHDTAV